MRSGFAACTRWEQPKGKPRTDEEVCPKCDHWVKRYRTTAVLNPDDTRGHCPCDCHVDSGKLGSAQRAASNRGRKAPQASEGETRT